MRDVKLYLRDMLREYAQLLNFKPVPGDKSSCYTGAAKQAKQAWQLHVTPVVLVAAEHQGHSRLPQISALGLAAACLMTQAEVRTQLVPVELDSRLPLSSCCCHLPTSAAHGDQGGQLYCSIHCPRGEPPAAPH